MTWEIKDTENWHCWICGENTSIEWWRNTNAAKQYAICHRCKPMFIKVIVEGKRPIGD